MISVEVLESIPVDAETVSAVHGIPYNKVNSPLLREDITKLDPRREEILKQAPELEDGYIVVPDISYQELD